jgi:GT2 family glycosyltransferase/SAM-dependent methyltransferase
MAVERRAGAPRLVEWTGERCVPWAPDVQVIYEHYHRYMWAAALAEGKRVLDLGSGEGFGSAILAETAAHVTGIDVDAVTVEHSQLNYRAPNLEFGQRSALALEELDAGSFDAVIAFELIEHVKDHEGVMRGIAHVLAPDGLLVISTPDRRTYRAATGLQNPFHERELTEPELRALLDAHFPHVRLFGQRAVTGSRIAAADPPDRLTTRPFALRRVGDDWRRASEPAPIYLVAVASRAELPQQPSDSLLSDYELTLVSEQLQSADASRQERDAAQRDLAAERQALAAAREQMERERAESALHAHEQQTALETSFDRIAAQRSEIEQLRAERAAEAQDLKRMRESVVWTQLQRARGKVYGTLGGPGSRRSRSLQWSLRSVGRALGSNGDDAESSKPAFTPIAIPQFEQPVASLVVTAYRGAEVTAACLRSIAEHTEGPAFEVIVVDDAADADNARLWEQVSGATILVNDPGIGYLRSVNRGAAEARGRYLVLLNNDVEVEVGWLRALVRRAESADDVGAVAPKLLYPDGTLQEAGAIVFEDGSGWNYGRGLDPDAPEFSYAREIDYGSAACLLVRADLFSELGGLDERYAPMYYEDTDLCFALRDRGHRVMFEPTARVVHHEGVSAGTDISTGGKRHQELNRPKFVEKWRTQLERGHLRPSPSSVRRASQRCAGPHVLVVDHKVPTPDQDSGSLRMLRMLEALLELDCRVTFLPDDHRRHEPYASDLQARGVEVLYAPFDLSAHLASIGPHLELAILSRPYVAARYLHLVREHAPAARVAYDTVDLHFVREQRRAELGEHVASSKSASMRELELGLVRASDVTIVVSDEEQRELNGAAEGAPIVVVPNATEIVADVAPLEDRSGVLFVGGFQHPPNVDAAVHLVRRVMPLVWQKLPSLSVVLVGPDAPQEVEALAGPNVEVAGWVEELGPLLDRARMTVAPLRYGAGMKGKVTQSLGVGLPVVTTSIGAEGLGATDGEEMLIADDDEGLAERILRLERDDALWRQLSAAGQEVVQRTASHAVMRAQLAALLGRDA